jgi:hypothetical protein
MEEPALRGEENALDCESVKLLWRVVEKAIILVTVRQIKKNDIDTFE